jgi:tetratricopeptide (TPR) repeat protein
MKKSDILLQALSLHRSGDIKGAKIFYEKALEIDPVNPDALRLSGLASRQLGDLDEAIALLEKACFTQPRNTIFCKDYADALLEKKNIARQRYFTVKRCQLNPLIPKPGSGPRPLITVQAILNPRLKI